MGDDGTAREKTAGWIWRRWLTALLAGCWAGAADSLERQRRFSSKHFNARLDTLRHAPRNTCWDIQISSVSPAGSARPLHVLGVEHVIVCRMNGEASSLFRIGSAQSVGRRNLKCPCKEDWACLWNNPRMGCSFICHASIAHSVQQCALHAWGQHRPDHCKE